MALFRVLLRSWFLHPLSELTYLVTGLLLAIVANVAFGLHHQSELSEAKISQIKLAILYISPALPKGAETSVFESTKTILDSYKLSANTDSEVSGSTIPMKHLQLVTTDQFIAQLKQKYPKIAEELLQVDSEVEKLIPRYISYAGPLPSGAVEALKAVPHIERIEFHERKAEIWRRHVERLSSLMRWSGWIALACLGVWLLLLASNEKRIHLPTQKHLKRLGSHPFLQLTPVGLNILTFLAILSIVSSSVGPRLEKRATQYLLSDLTSTVGQK